MSNSFNGKRSVSKYIALKGTRSNIRDSPESKIQRFRTLKNNSKLIFTMEYKWTPS